ncbi:MAG: alpha/beta fold hydrolase [Planctomycetes bacterium]|nr:alpha/beta fold hydrolase [Planctomycetota bacterium]
MPFATVADVRLRYEVQGEGAPGEAPVLLLAGLGRGLDLWDAQAHALARRFRTVLVDNRGVGESDAPPGPYSARQMAADAVAVLDELGIARAHVVGASLGGFLAQEVALGWPERVARLALLGTAFGGDRCRRMAESTWRALAERGGMPYEDYLWRAVPLGFSEKYLERHRDGVARSIRARAARPVSPEAWMAQAYAGATFDASDRLAGLSCPTLVMAGTADIVVPPANAWLLSRAIPGARIALYPGAGHYFFVERAEEVNRDLIAFLEGDR